LPLERSHPAASFGEDHADVLIAISVIVTRLTDSADAGDGVVDGRGRRLAESLSLPIGSGSADRRSLDSWHA